MPKLASNPKGSRILGILFWWLDTARPKPERSVAPLRCFAAFLHEGEHVCFLIGWDLVLEDVACDSCAVVIAVAIDVPPHAHFHLSFPARPVLWELFAERVLPGFASCHCRILVLCQILDEVAVVFLALTLLLVAAVSFSFVSCGGMLGFLDGCSFG
jgi:hypothetical protein